MNKLETRAGLESDEKKKERNQSYVLRFSKDYN
jgi:hypothetical protein